MDTNKSYRVRANINSDKILNVNLNRDIDFLEILSLKIRQEDSYRIQSSNYGVLVGRVQANDGFGVPNAKVSLFIEISETDKNDTVISSIYPYSSTMSKNKDGVRYNLLKNDSDNNCHAIVGTFPNKNEMLADDLKIEVFEKYWKYTTTTNHAGDYMFFGIPNGSHTLHVDVDLSDIGILSQKPSDMYYKGYNKDLFENANQFKASKNIDSLPQIITQNKSVNIHPFWGDGNYDTVAISRCDVDINYKFEPTCVFMGSIITDSESNFISHKCVNHNGKAGQNQYLTSKKGTIEMIRKTMDDTVEEFQIKGNELINGDGVWCYQIPMNLDYVITDEFGNIVPTDNPNKGIPTRTRVRFRISIDNSDVSMDSNHTANYLIPNTFVNKLGGDFDPNIYQFGSLTPDEQFRDLYWNDVYSIKSYIPRLQMRSWHWFPHMWSKVMNFSNCNKTATGIKYVNYHEDKNPFPYNKINICKKWWVGIFCAILKAFISLIDVIQSSTLLKDLSFTVVNDEDGEEIQFKPTSNNNHKYCLQTRLYKYILDAYKIVDLGFYNDWINGSLYAPLLNFKKHENDGFSWCSCNSIEHEALKPYYYDNCNKNNNMIGYDKHKYNDNISTRYYAFEGNGIVYKFNMNYMNDADYSNSQINKISSDDILYYSSYYKKTPLFATDIILLGNLNDGVELLNRLPSTTSKIPKLFGDDAFCSSTKVKDDDTSDFYLMDEVADDNDYVTPMDWGSVDEFKEGTSFVYKVTRWLRGEWNGKDYNRGLFFNFSCGKIMTHIKTCYNAKRICELGVGFDTDRRVLKGDDYDQIDLKYDNKETYQTDDKETYQYDDTGKEEYTTIPADGVILKNDIVDNDIRSLFATYNSEGLLSKYIDRSTLYKKNKFMYLYPNDFDGEITDNNSLYSVRKKFFEWFTEDNQLTRVNLTEDKSDDYTTFRGYDNENNIHNNSFYFYFGLRDGNTAIDEYNKLFSMNCFKENKNLSSPSVYIEHNLCDKKTIIRGIVGNIAKPYSIQINTPDQKEITLNEQDGEYFNIETDLVVIGETNETILGEYKYSITITDAYNNSVSNTYNSVVKKLDFDVTNTHLPYPVEDESKTNNTATITLSNFKWPYIFENSTAINNMIQYPDEFRPISLYPFIDNNDKYDKVDESDEYVYVDENDKDYNNKFRLGIWRKNSTYNWYYIDAFVIDDDGVEKKLSDSKSNNMRVTNYIQSVKLRIDNVYGKCSVQVEVKKPCKYIFKLYANCKDDNGKVTDYLLSKYSVTVNNGSDGVLFINNINANDIYSQNNTQQNVINMVYKNNDNFKPSIWANRIGKYMNNTLLNSDTFDEWNEKIKLSNKINTNESDVKKELKNISTDDINVFDRNIKHNLSLITAYMISNLISLCKTLYVKDEDSSEGDEKYIEIKPIDSEKWTVNSDVNICINNKKIPSQNDSVSYDFNINNPNLYYYDGNVYASEYLHTGDRIAIESFIESVPFFPLNTNISEDNPLENQICLYSIDRRFGYDLRIFLPFAIENMMWYDEDTTVNGSIAGYYINPNDICINEVTYNNNSFSTILQFSPINSCTFSDDGKGIKIEMNNIRIQFNNNNIIIEPTIINSESSNSTYSYSYGDDINATNLTNSQLKYDIIDGNIIIKDYGSINTIFRYLTNFIRIIQLNNINLFNGEYINTITSLREMLLDINVFDTTTEICQYCINNNFDINICRFYTKEEPNNAEQNITEYKFIIDFDEESLKVDSEKLNKFLRLCGFVFDRTLSIKCEYSYYFDINYKNKNGKVNFYDYGNIIHQNNWTDYSKKYLKTKQDCINNDNDDKILLPYNSTDLTLQTSKVSNGEPITSNGFKDKYSQKPTVPIRVVRYDNIYTDKINSIIHQGYAIDDNVKISNGDDAFGIYLKPSTDKEIEIGTSDVLIFDNTKPFICVDFMTYIHGKSTFYGVYSTKSNKYKVIIYRNDAKITDTTIEDIDKSGVWFDGLSINVTDSESEKTLIQKATDNGKKIFRLGGGIIDNRNGSDVHTIELIRWKTKDMTDNNNQLKRLMSYKVEHLLNVSPIQWEITNSNNKSYITFTNNNKWFYDKLLNIGQNNFNGVAYMEINSKRVQITKVIDNTDDNVVKFEYTTPQEIDEHYFIFKTDTDKNFNDDDLIMYRINLIPGL